MHKKLLPAILIIAVLCGCARSANIKTISRVVFKPPDVAKAHVKKELPFTQFQVGERGAYLVAWKGIPVGTVTSTIKKKMEYEGRQVYVIELVARTNKFLDKIYRIEDRYVTYLDAETFTSRYYKAIRREGNYKKDLVLNYDFEKKIAIYKNLRDGSVKTCPIIEPVQDPLSAVYFCRTVDVKLGDMINFYVTLNERNYRVYGHIASVATVTVPEVGTFDAALIRPYVMLDGKDIKKGRAWGYVSTAEKRVPLYGTLKIPWLGEFTATLQKGEYIDPVRNKISEAVSQE